MSHSLPTTLDARRKYAYVSLALHALSLIGGLILLFLLLSRDSYYFEGPAFVILVVLLPISITASALLSFFMRRDVPAAHVCYKSHFSKLCTDILFMAVILAFGGYHIVRGIALISGSRAAGIALTVSGISAVCGLRFTAHSITKKAQLQTVISGCALSLSAVLYALYLYFDVSSPKNASLKQLLILTFLSFSLFFLSEVRRTLGKPHGLFYRFFIAAAGHLSAALAIAPLFLLLAGQQIPVGDVCTYLFIAVFFLYIIIWTVLPHFACDREPKPLESAYADFANDAAAPVDTAACEAISASDTTASETEDDVLSIQPEEPGDAE